MKKQSAGIVVYRKKDGRVEVLLGHAGGPFWSKKDTGAWSIPKGECSPGEDLQAAARREFAEETGVAVPKGELYDLGWFKRKDGKVVYAWAVEGDMNATKLVSNTFEMEWPPRSGRMQQFPEFDRAGWFSLNQAGVKLHQGQSIFIERLAEYLQVPLASAPDEDSDTPEPQQASLF